MTRVTIRRLTARTAIAATLSIVAGIFVIVNPIDALKAEAYTGNDFDPGYIISDGNFYDPNAMSAAEVQGFIDGKISACAPGIPCLKDLRIDTFDIPGTPMCRSYSGAPGESAATIIYKVGFACGVSQAALLVMLQKEQGLVNNPRPSMAALSAAMGVGCYDNGEPCVGTYSGFFNQIFNAAYLLKRYTQPAGTGPGTAYTTRFDLRYPVGQVSPILYHPNTGCGTKPVFITNQATHALYIYTPYTPNQAALDHLRATGDVCSSYGNRNFWQLYYDWFGDPTLSRAPVGWLDTLFTIGRQVTATGWSIDYDTTGPVDVALIVDGVVVSSGPASTDYPGLASSSPGFGTNHGFSLTSSLSAGSHNVCVTAINDSIGGNRSLGCRAVTVLSATPPTGWLDKVMSVGNTVTASGWAIDPDTTSSTNVQLTIDGETKALQAATATYPGLGKARPGFGDNHGFFLSATTTSGAHQVCVVGVDGGSAGNSTIGCRTLTTTTTTAPTGFVDSVYVVGRQITAKGWAIDPDTTSPIAVSVVIDGAPRPQVVASSPYAGLGSARPGYGDNHGFSASTPVSPGSHNVCIAALNDGAGGDRTLSCRIVDVPASSIPVGWIDGASIQYQKATIAGWALDADTANSIEVTVSVDGSAQPASTANTAHLGLGAAFPGFGDAHGFSVDVRIPIGTHTVCVTASDDAGGANRSLGCRQLDATSEPPTGWLDSISTFGRSVTATGWAIDPDTTGSVKVNLSIDGKTSQFLASNPYAGLGAAKPGFGDNHGFSASSAVSPGQHTVCVTAQNNDVGDERSLGCRTVSVAAATAPAGWVDSITPAAGTISAAGWALDPDLSTPVKVTLNIDGTTAVETRAGSTYPGLGSVFPVFGSAHGFNLSAPSPSGPHSVCVLAIDDSEPSLSHSIGCASVVVP